MQCVAEGNVADVPPVLLWSISLCRHQLGLLCVFLVHRSVACTGFHEASFAFGISSFSCFAFFFFSFFGAGY